MTVTSSRLVGVPAAPGIAIGGWAEVGRPTLPPPRPIAQHEIAAEVARLQDAARTAGRDLRELAARVRDAGHADEAAIFGAQAAIARDPDLVDAATRAIQAGAIDAAAAIVAAAGEVADRIQSLADERLRGRATDVLDVGDRIARRLAGLSPEATLASPAILVGEDLAPSLAATLPRERILGIALERSSATAHAAILARAYGIPAVVGAAGLLEALRAADSSADLAIDGSTGELVIAPDGEARVRFVSLAEAASAAHARDRGDAVLPARTTDGVEVTLLANIGHPDECADAVSLGATGVGLFRTEFLFLERSAPPGEDEQAAAYRRVVEAFPGGSVVVRLLDVGGDKPIPYLPLPKEDNPFLGVRALRIADRRPDVFVTQLRACYRAAVAGPIRVMAPMVADRADVELLLALAERARNELRDEGTPTGEVVLGVMLEIPAAVLVADTYLAQLGFASLGTNDLLQYTLAVDRGNAALERYRDALHPAQLRLIRLAVEAAERAGVSLSVCGEMAGDPAAALALVGLGVRVLSMSAASLPAVRRAIRDADSSSLADASQAACLDASAAEARARFTGVAGLRPG
jgi:phosphoenolpyruvate-protein phosphotransferase